jgi:hypothetical protein
LSSTPTSTLDMTIIQGIHTTPKRSFLHATGNPFQQQEVDSTHGHTSKSCTPRYVDSCQNFGGSHFSRASLLQHSIRNYDEQHCMAEAQASWTRQGLAIITQLTLAWACHVSAALLSALLTSSGLLRFLRFASWTIRGQGFMLSLELP